MTTCDDMDLCDLCDIDVDENERLCTMTWTCVTSMMRMNDHVR